MKKFLFSILACSAMAISGCNNGDYNATPGAPGGTNTLNTGGSSGSSNSSFNWTGTDPMSAKIDGAGWTATTATVSAASGFISIQGSTTDGRTMIINLPDNLTLNSTINISGSTSAGWDESITSMYSSATGNGGAAKVTENDATHIKGYFYFNAKNISGGSDSKNITEGYFNVTK